MTEQLLRAALLIQTDYVHLTKHHITFTKTSVPCATVNPITEKLAKEGQVMVVQIFIADDVKGERGYL